MGWENPAPQPAVALAAAFPNASHTGDLLEVILATIAVPANLLGPNGRLHIEALWSRAGAGGTATIRTRFGATGSGLAGPFAPSGPIAAGQPQASTLTILANQAATNSQTGQNAAGGIIAPYGAAGSGPSTSAVDTTQATEINITGQLAVAGDTITLVSYRIMAYPHL
jgi:hypothetical protein